MLCGFWGRWFDRVFDTDPSVREKVILFGSRARGDFAERSDIDLAFKGGEAARFILDVNEETDTLLLFDILNLEEPVQDGLLDSIQNEGVALYEKV